MSSQRKDYGSDAIVEEGNKTMRRVDHVNSPNSVEATGSENVKQVIENYDDIQVGDRLLKGNNEEIVSAVNKTNEVLDDIETEYRDGTVNDPLEDEVVTTAYTKAELEAATFSIVKGSVNTIA